MEAGLWWIIEKRNSTRFPYRLKIVSTTETILCLKVLDIWPGERGTMFCLRELPHLCEMPSEEVERVPVLSMKRVGRKLNIILNRSQRKRCDFLFLTSKTKSGKEVERIYWRTEKVLKESPTRAKLTGGKVTVPLKIIVDTNEKYPWKFPGAEVEVKPLPAGDYALVGENEYLAIVERKTFDNFLSELNNLQIFHQKLVDLESYPNSVLVVEGRYEDFLNPEKNKFLDIWFTRKAIAEIQAMHSVPIVFPGKRKLAIEWVKNYFEAVYRNYIDRDLFLTQWKNFQNQESRIIIPEELIKKLQKLIKKFREVFEDNLKGVVLYNLKDLYPEEKRVVFLHLTLKDVPKDSYLIIRKIIASKNYQFPVIVTMSDVHFTSIRKELISSLMKGKILYGNLNFKQIGSAAEQINEIQNDIKKVLEKIHNTQDKEELLELSFQFISIFIKNELENPRKNFKENLKLYLQKSPDKKLKKPIIELYEIYLNTKFSGIQITPEIEAKIKRNLKKLIKASSSSGNT